MTTATFATKTTPAQAIIMVEQRINKVSAQLKAGIVCTVQPIAIVKADEVIDVKVNFSALYHQKTALIWTALHQLASVIDAEIISTNAMTATLRVFI